MKRKIFFIDIVLLIVCILFIELNIILSGWCKLLSIPGFIMIGLCWDSTPLRKLLRLKK